MTVKFEIFGDRQTEAPILFHLKPSSWDCGQVGGINLHIVDPEGCSKFVVLSISPQSGLNLYNIRGSGLRCARDGTIYRAGSAQEEQAPSLAVLSALRNCLSRYEGLQKVYSVYGGGQGKSLVQALGELNELVAKELVVL